MKQCHLYEYYPVLADWWLSKTVGIAAFGSSPPIRLAREATSNIKRPAEMTNENDWAVDYNTRAPPQWVSFSKQVLAQVDL